MQFRNIDIEIDLFDVDDFTKLSKGIEAMMRKGDRPGASKGKNPSLKEANFMREFCTDIVNFFVEVVGKENADMLFDGKLNYRVCGDTYLELLELLEDDRQEVIDYTQQLKERINRLKLTTNEND